MISCPQLHAELEGVLARERFLRWRTREQLDRYATDLRTMAHQVSDPVDVPSVTRDPGDDYLVALTALVRADVLCSGDADLTQLSDEPVLRQGHYSTSSGHARVRARDVGQTDAP